MSKVLVLCKAFILNKNWANLIKTVKQCTKTIKVNNISCNGPSLATEQAYLLHKWNENSDDHWFDDLNCFGINRIIWRKPMLVHCEWCVQSSPSIVLFDQYYMDIFRYIFAKYLQFIRRTELLSFSILQSMGLSNCKENLDI